MIIYKITIVFFDFFRSNAFSGYEINQKNVRYRFSICQLNKFVAMKRVYFTAIVVYALFLQNIMFSQSFDKIDDNPTDIAYWRKNKVSRPLVKVVYSRPHKNEDNVFGDQVPYNKIWRTGDNEATEVKFYKDMKFGNKLVKAGTYIMHTIPGEKEWTIILNSNTDTWGAFFYDQSKDVARIKIPTRKAEELDVFSIAFKQDFKNCFMVLGWDSTRINIPLHTQGGAVLAKI